MYRAGTYNLIKNATRVAYMAGTNFQGNPIAEGFTTSVYPPPGFGAINADNGPGWSRSTVAGGYNTSTESTKYDFFNNSVVGDKDELYLPPLNLSGVSGTQLSFDLACAQRNANSNDALDILVSDNCGITWTSVYSKAGALLATTAPNSFAYTPDSGDPSHWRTDQVDLSTFHQANLLVKFVTTSDNGNNLYLDNINLSFATGINKNTISSLKMSLYPNPTTGATQLSLNNMKAGAAKISVVNTLGQVVYVKQINLAEGANTIALDLKEQAAGIYNVMIDSNNGSVVKKLTLTK